MIIWINGAFGSGKTSIAENICKKMRVAYLYDPEQVGYFLWDNFPQEMKRKGNFQHSYLERIQYENIKIHR